MQGEFGAFKKVKKKLTKLSVKKLDSEEEAEDLPEDSSEKEVSQRKIKQKLVHLREKFGEEIYEDSELAKARLKQRIAKLGEKLKKEDKDGDEEFFDDAEDKEKTGMRIKQRIVRLGEKLRRDGDEAFDDSEEPKKTTTVKIKHKIAKISEKLRRDDDDEDEDRPGSGRSIRNRLSKISEKLRHKDEDKEDDDELFEDCIDDDHKMGIKEKLVKFSELLKKDDPPEDSLSIDDRSPKRSRLDHEEDKTKTSGRIKQKLVKLFESDKASLDVDIEDALTHSPSKGVGKKTSKMKVFSDKLKDGDDKDSLSTEDERETRQSKFKSFKSRLKSEEECVESSDTERRVPEDAETVSQSGSEGRTEMADLHGSEGNLLEKLGQRLKERSDKVQRVCVVSPTTKNVVPVFEAADREIMRNKAFVYIS